jgi:hypothetical protein
MQEALNRHVQHETFSSYLYVAMSAWCEAKAWKGFARWLRAQADEERQHAAKSLEYLLARGGEARLGAIEAPPFAWPSINALFEAVLDHERKVTAFVDLATGRITRSAGDLDVPGMKTGFVTDYSDFRPVEGVLFPFREGNFASGQTTGETVITKVTVNPPLADSEFRP